MRSSLQVWMAAFLFSFTSAFIPSGGLLAQQATGAPMSELDKLTGPIALYPDDIVIPILTASKNYDTLKLLSGWLEQNANLKGSELQDAAAKAGYSEELVALVLFPEVVKMMAEKPDWTKGLGQAVTKDKKGVNDSIQRLRVQAQSLGNLKTTPQQIVIVTNVVVERTVEQQVVVVTNTIVQIQPANPQVIYVPTYPQTVYVYAAPPPSSATVASAALVGFTVGVIVANNNHYHHHHSYWDEREDFYEDRRETAEHNQNQRQDSSQQRQTERQGDQDQRQSERQGNQDQRQSGAQEKKSSGGSAQSQASAGNQSRQSASASPSSGSRSGGSSYQSGSSTRSESSRGSASRSSSRSGGGGGGRSGGGGRR